jgi:peroxiredoxin Q/BCP
MRLQPGDIAPDFVLADADGRTRSLMEWRGDRVILYFYPAAMTPGCTTQACDFQDNLTVLDRAGVSVVGISPDPVAKLAAFRDKHQLSFTLLSDPAREVLQAYGAYGEKTSYGKTVIGVIRSTIVVDAHGKVDQAFYNVKATGHVAKLLRDLSIAA